MKRVIAAFALFTATPTVPQAFDVAPMTDEELDESRGGFSLPGGVVVNIGVTTDTRVDGREVLRTVFAIDPASAQTIILAAQQGQGALTPVDVGPNGSVQVADGVIRFRAGADGSRVELAGDRLDISHLVGGAIGSIVANSANDRTIEISTSVDITLSGVRPDQIGGSAARVDDLALGATTQLVRF